MAAELRETLGLLRQHLVVAGVQDEFHQVWTLAPSPIAGRGVVATRDIAAGELIFYDVPLVVGPRVGRHCSPVPVCVGCHDGPSELVPCSKGCGLPVCSEKCESTPLHEQECEKIRSWGVLNGSSWSPELLRAVTPIRCLALGSLQRQVLKCLQFHSGSQHGFEVDIIKRNTEKGPSEEDEEFMRLACCVMDANAFETARISKELLKKSESICSREELRLMNPMGPSLRGLYPLAAMMNHACTPNTRHGYDENHRMIVCATVNIPKDTEITNSYTALLWGTPARRHQLELTKHFLCECPRCADPQEGGSRLSALKCLTQTCKGAMFPLDSLNEDADWSCEVCGRHVTGRKGILMQSNLGRLLGVIDCRNPEQMERFLQEHHLIAPSTNQIVIDVKCCLIRMYGHTKGRMWSEITDEQVQLKEELCRELLLLLEKLGAGQCRLRGLLLYELHCTLIEMHRRRQGATEKKLETTSLLKDAFATVEECENILRQDTSAPLDLRLRKKECKELMDAA